MLKYMSCGSGLRIVFYCYKELSAVRGEPQEENLNNGSPAEKRLTVCSISSGSDESRRISKLTASKGDPATQQWGCVS